MDIEFELNNIQEEILYIKKNLRTIGIALVLLVCVSVIIPLVALITSFSFIVLLILSMIQLICVIAFAGFVFSLLANGSWKVIVNLKRQEEVKKEVQGRMKKRAQKMEENEFLE